MSDYKAFNVVLADKVAHVVINRPEKINAMSADFWSEIIDIFRWVDNTDEVRVVVLSGAGKHFSSGIDLMMLAQLQLQEDQYTEALASFDRFFAETKSSKPEHLVLKGNALYRLDQLLDQPLGCRGPGGDPERRDACQPGPVDVGRVVHQAGVAGPGAHRHFDQSHGV